MNLDLHNILLTGIKEHVFAEVFLHKDSYTISFILASMKKGNLIINTKKTGIHSFDEFVKQIPAHIPVHFFISGSGIISRTIVRSNEKDNEVAFRELFPTIDENEVYYTTNDFDEISVINIIRKNKLEGILDEIKAMSIHCIYLEIGLGVTGILGGYLAGSEVHLRGTLLTFIDGKLDGFSKSSGQSESIQIGDETIQYDYILAYVGALNYYEKREGIAPSNQLTVLIQGLRNDYLFQRLFSKGWKSSLLFLFFILLVNFMMFNSYSDKNNQLRQQQSMMDHNQQKKKESQSKQVELREVFKESGFQNNYNYSMFMDDLSDNMLSGMALTRVEMNPEHLKGKKKSSFTFNRVRVQGTVLNTDLLNNYVNHILFKTWASDVSIQTIDGSRSTAAMYFDFDILLAE